MPTHKFNTMPTRSFLLAMVKKYINQRAIFVLTQNSRWYTRLIDAGFDPDKSIYVNGIFVTLWKRPECWPKAGPVTIALEFRDVLFQQSDITALACRADRRSNKHARYTFRIDEMGTCKLKEKLGLTMDPNQKLIEGGIDESVGFLAGRISLTGLNTPTDRKDCKNKPPAPAPLEL